MYGYYYYFYDWTYILVIIGTVICLIASARVNSTFNKYDKVRSLSGLTGAQAAERMLKWNGIYDVTIQHISGKLTDNYDPSKKTLNLSDSTYNSTSVAAVGVAAHECGHAIQHQKAYVPLKIRSAIVPVVNFGSKIAWPLIVLGFFITGETGDLILQIGIWAFCLAVLFQLITLPVEFNASKRAVSYLDQSGMLSNEELKGTKKVLKAAALTYVASAAAVLLQLIRLLFITRGRNRD